MRIDEYDLNKKRLETINNEWGLQNQMRWNLDWKIYLGKDVYNEKMDNNFHILIITLKGVIWDSNAYFYFYFLIILIISLKNQKISLISSCYSSFLTTSLEGCCNSGLVTHRLLVSPSLVAVTSTFF